MPVSNSVIRRYTPPTCTLEVLAQSSALSKWMGKSILKDLRFELRFDDPQLSEEKKIAIRGDRDQLETLCVVVTNYIQEFLQMSPESFWANFSVKDDTNPSSDEPLAPNLTNSVEQTNRISFYGNQIPRTNIYIQPKTHLTHNLFLGPLANQTSGAVIPLSLLQLFDLATALDEYSADVLALPTLDRTIRASAIPAWAPVAAVMVVAVGLTPLTWQYGNRLRQQYQTATKSRSVQEPIALQTPPSTVLSLPTPSPSNNLSPLQPQPTFGGNFPLPNSTSVPSIQPFPSQPPTPEASSKFELPSTPLASSQSPFSPSTQTSPSIDPTATLPSSGKILTIPNTTPTFPSSPQNTASLNKLPNQKVALVPKQSSVSTSQTESSLEADIKNPSLSTPNSGITTPSTSSLSTSGSNSNPSAIRSKPALQPNTLTPSDTDALIARLRQSSKNSNIPTEVATTSSTSDTLFDKTQLVQAREFLKDRWQPPDGLKQAIEYSLIVGVDGTIERIMPLGKAARDFVDRTGMPLIGEPFVSANKNGQSVRIRAVFSPDGKVQTFPESQ